MLIHMSAYSQCRQELERPIFRDIGEPGADRRVYSTRPTWSDRDWKFSGQLPSEIWLEIEETVCTSIEEFRSVSIAFQDQNYYIRAPQGFSGQMKKIFSYE